MLKKLPVLLMVFCAGLLLASNLGGCAGGSTPLAQVTGFGIENALGGVAKAVLVQKS
jgi:hypothetical protein